MRTITHTIMAGIMGTLLTTGAAWATEEEKPAANLTVGAYSQYLWRGWALSRDSIVLQPSMTVSYQGFAGNIWGNLDTSPHNAADDTNNLTEVDYTLSYDASRGKVKYGAGYIYYGLDAAADTQEIYAKLGLDVLLAPTLTVYRDIDHLPGWYLTLGLSHSFALPHDISLDLGAQAGYYKVDDAKSMADPKDAGKAYEALHNGLVSAGLTIPVGRYVKVLPSIAWSFALSGEGSDRLKADNRSVIAEEEDSFIYGGMAISFSF